MTTVSTLPCESCGAAPDPATNVIRHRAVGSAPGMEELERWTWDGVAEATDGCEVEPDGYCEHGHKSWLLRLGMI